MTTTLEKSLNVNTINDIATRLLNDATNDLKFCYSEARFESTLQINDYTPIFFSDNAGGTVAGGSAHWIREKHKNKSVHEPATIAAFSFVRQNFASRVNTIFDIGALYGYFSLISKSMFPDSNVFSFEMNPVSYRALSNNINVNKHLGFPATRCVNVGLSDRTLFQREVAIQNFSLEENTENKSAQLSTIDIVSVDDFCRISGFKPDLIKIDVEGYQAKILPGAIATIQSKKPIIILEFDGATQLEKVNTTNKEITKPLFDLGYSCYWCRNQRSSKGEFQQINYDTFSTHHEVNSLSVFIP